MIEIKENELYQEIELFIDGEKIGEAEVDIKGKMLSRLSIFPPYRNKGYGTQVVKLFNEKYSCDVLWVNADNERAIHVYEKNGYEISKPTMYLMERKIADKRDVKHGHWELLEECSNTGVYCSVCSKKVYKPYYANQKLKSKFCPNCGAIMDEEVEE